MARKKERDDPRISMTKLAEYMSAQPRRRRQIIEDQKRPKDYIVPIYADAVVAARDCLLRGGDERVVTRAIKVIASRAVTTDWEVMRQQSCIEGLEAFLELLPTVDLDGANLRPGDAEPPMLDVAGVSISVRPEVTLKRGGKLGAVRIYFSKGYVLGTQSGQYGTTVLHHFVEQFLGKPDPKLSILIDVFGGEVHTAPLAHRRRRADIEAACEEIALRWPTA